MNLTRLQKDIIEHRLSVPCAMADVMCDEYPTLFRDWDDYESAISLRAKDYIKRLIDGSPLDEIDLYMLEDIMSDEVFVDLAEGADPDECSAIKAAGIRKSHEYLCIKLQKLWESYNGKG